MMALEDMPSSVSSNSEPSEPVNPALVDNANVSQDQAETQCKSCFSSCFGFCCSNKQNCSENSTVKKSRNKVEPVIFQPMDDIYLQLKPNRRLRVIHMNSRGAFPTQHAYYLQNSGYSLRKYLDFKLKIVN